MRPSAKPEAVSIFWKAPPNGGSLFSSQPDPQTIVFSVLFQRLVMQAWTLFFV
jgi:hypothetical protein